MWDVMTFLMIGITILVLNWSKWHQTWEGNVSGRGNLPKLRRPVFSKFNLWLKLLVLRPWVWMLRWRVHPHGKSLRRNCGLQWRFWWKELHYDNFWKWPLSQRISSTWEGYRPHNSFARHGRHSCQQCWRVCASISCKIFHSSDMVSFASKTY